MSYLTSENLGCDELWRTSKPLCDETQIRSDGRFVNLSLQPVNSAADHFELRVIVSRERRLSLRLQLTNARFDRSLVDADYRVMLVLNAQSFRECDEQM